jgi:hypothetical protein
MEFLKFFILTYFIIIYLKYISKGKQNNILVEKNL